MRSPLNSSIFDMYDRSSRSVKSRTNSARSSGVRACQWRPSERRAVSPKSKISSAMRRTAVRRSGGLLLRLGFSRVLTTRSSCVLSWSSGWAAAAGRVAVRPASSPIAHNTVTIRRVIARASCRLDLAEDVLGDQLFEVDGSLHFPDAAVGLDELVGRARADANELLADQPLRLDRCDGVLLQLHVRVQAERDTCLVVGQADRLDSPDLHAGDLHAGSHPQPADRREVGNDVVTAAGQEGDPAEFN